MNSQEKKHNKYMSEALSLFNNEFYLEAINASKRFLKLEGVNVMDIKFMINLIIDSYKILGDYNKLEKWYLKLTEFIEGDEKAAIFNYLYESNILNNSDKRRYYFNMAYNNFNDFNRKHLLMNFVNVLFNEGRYDEIASLVDLFTYIDDENLKTVFKLLISLKYVGEMYDINLYIKNDLREIYNSFMKALHNNEDFIKFL